MNKIYIIFNPLFALVIINWKGADEHISICHFSFIGIPRHLSYFYDTSIGENTLNSKCRQPIMQIVFIGMNFILYNPYTENIWKAALNSFNQNLRSAEEFVGKKIKQKLASCSGNILQVSLSVFQVYKQAYFKAFHEQFTLILAKT